MLVAGVLCCCAGEREKGHEGACLKLVAHWRGSAGGGDAKSDETKRVWVCSWRRKSPHLADPQHSTLTAATQTATHQGARDNRHPSSLLLNAGGRLSPGKRFSTRTLRELDAKLEDLPTRRELIAMADLQYCGEMFRFLSAVLDWEQVPPYTQPSTMAAYKIVATFVEVGSRYECNLSPEIRLQLVNHKLVGERVNPDFFRLAQLEVLADVLLNPFLKSLVATSSPRFDPPSPLLHKSPSFTVNST